MLKMCIYVYFVDFVQFEMMLWLLNDGEIMIIWCRCCCVMMFSSIYALDVDESIVVIELWWFCNFCENGLIMKKFDFDDVEWVKEVVRTN